MTEKESADKSVFEYGEAEWEKSVTLRKNETCHACWQTIKAYYEAIYSSKYNCYFHVACGKTEGGRVPTKRPKKTHRCAYCGRKIHKDPIKAEGSWYHYECPRVPRRKRKQSQPLNPEHQKKLGEFLIERLE